MQQQVLPFGISTARQGLRTGHLQVLQAARDVARDFKTQGQFGGNVGHLRAIGLLFTQSDQRLPLRTTRQRGALERALPDQRMHKSEASGHRAVGPFDGAFSAQQAAHIGQLQTTLFNFGQRFLQRRSHGCSAEAGAGHGGGFNEAAVRLDQAVHLALHQRAQVVGQGGAQLVHRLGQRPATVHHTQFTTLAQRVK